MIEVMNPMTMIVRVEKISTCNPKKLNADNTIRPSINRIISPIFIENALAINCANKSVPPVLVLYRSINPTPTPIRIPPKNTLEKQMAKIVFVTVLTNQ